MRKLSAVIALAFAALLLTSACDGGGQPATAKIAFVSDRDGNAEIYVMNADGSGLTNLTNNPESDFFRNAWSPAEPSTANTPAIRSTAGKPASPTAPASTPVIGTTAEQSASPTATPDIATPPAPEGYIEQEPYAGAVRRNL